MRRWAFWRRAASADPASVRTEPTIRPTMRISRAALASAGGDKQNQTLSPWDLPKYPPGVLPDAKLAMDSAPFAGVAGWAGGYHGQFAEGIGFYGYPYLAELSQRPEYRVASEVVAEEMTRKWIILKATGDEDKSDKIKALTDAAARFKLREAFRDAMELDGFFGLSFIQIDLGNNDPEELDKPLLIDKAKIGKGSLKAFRVIDPTWTAPNQYNSADPTDPTFYKPQTWFVMGKQVHVSRLLVFTSRPVPDILKPAYNFGGLSLSQMMKPYVDNWLSTRQNINDLIGSFTVWNIQTNLQTLLQGDGLAASDRFDYFTRVKNNRGLMVTDKETESLSNISAPLGSLDALQAQAQEHMAAVTRTPLVKLLGISPSGLNASSDGEIRVWYDTIHGRQERVFTGPLKRAIEVLQLNEFGEIDPEITAEFVPLWELDEAGKAAVQKTKADTDAVLSDQGAIGPEDVRKRVSADSESPYHGLDGGAPGRPDGGEEGGLGDPSEHIDTEAEQGQQSGANSGV